MKFVCSKKKKKDFTSLLFILAKISFHAYINFEEAIPEILAILC